MKNDVFYLEQPKNLDLVVAEQLYVQATDQRADKDQSILVLLRQSLKLGHAESGWILINFIKAKNIANMTYQDKNKYFSYLLATAMLKHSLAFEQFQQLIPLLNTSEVKKFRHLLQHYRVMGYDTAILEDELDSNTEISRQLTESSGGLFRETDGVPPN